MLLCRLAHAPDVVMPAWGVALCVHFLVLWVHMLVPGLLLFPLWVPLWVLVVRSGGGSQEVHGLEEKTTTLTFLCEMKENYSKTVTTFTELAKRNDVSKSSWLQF